MFNWLNKSSCISGCKGYHLLEQSLERERQLLMRLNHTMDLLNKSDQKVHEYEAIWKLRQEKERDEKLKNDKAVADLLDGADYMNYKKTKGDLRDNLYRREPPTALVPLPKKPGRKPKVKAK